MHDGLAGGENPLAVGVSGGIRQIRDHVAHHFFGRIKAENGQVADIEFDEFLAFGFHLPRLIHNGAADVVEDVSQLRGFQNLFIGHDCASQKYRRPERKEFVVGRLGRVSAKISLFQGRKKKRIKKIRQNYID